MKNRGLHQKYSSQLKSVQLFKVPPERPNVALTGKLSHALAYLKFPPGKIDIDAHGSHHWLYKASYGDSPSSYPPDYHYLVQANTKFSLPGGKLVHRSTFDFASTNGEAGAPLSSHAYHRILMPLKPPLGAHLITIKKYLNPFQSVS